MDNDFPRMVYKAGGTEDIHGGKFTWLIVHDASELDAALEGGWYLTTPEAKDAATVPIVAVPAGNAAPNRAELEQKASELGVEFSPRIGDAKLAERIDAALAGKA